VLTGVQNQGQLAPKPRILPGGATRQVPDGGEAIACVCHAAKPRPSVAHAEPGSPRGDRASRAPTQVVCHWLGELKALNLKFACNPRSGWPIVRPGKRADMKVKRGPSVGRWLVPRQ